MYLGVLHACTSMHHVHALFSEARECSGSGTEVADGCEMCSGTWELNLGPLKSSQCSYPLNLVLQTN